MTSLIYDYPQMQKAVDFCWETQRMLTEATFHHWHPQRLKMHINSRKQLWRRFPAGVRTSANLIFMEQLHEQLGKSPEQRDTNKPVFINERNGWIPEGNAIAPDGGSTTGDGAAGHSVILAR